MIVGVDSLTLRLVLAHAMMARIVNQGLSAKRETRGRALSGECHQPYEKRA
jgi:hypothetical protein